MSEFGYTKENVKHFKVSDVSDDKKLLTIPPSINPNSLGIPLDV